MESTAIKPKEPVRVSISEPAPKSNGLTPFGYASVLAIGAYLGIVFTKSEVARWERVHAMFLFKEAHMYIVIGVGIAVAMVSMLFIKRFGITSVEENRSPTNPSRFKKVSLLAACCLERVGQSREHVQGRSTLRSARASGWPF